MAALFHLSKLSPFSAPNRLFPSQQRPFQLPSGACRYPCRRTFVISAASSSKRPRNGRKVKNNEELCSEIKQFLSLIGLPEGHVPSLKELSEHGRKDLANIVRRKGYKLIKELLATSSRVDNNGFHGEKSIVENHGAICDYEDMSAGQDENGSNAVPEVPSSVDVCSAANESLNGRINSDDQRSMKESNAYSLVEQDEMDNTTRVQDISLANNESYEQNAVKESGEHKPEEEKDLKGASVQAICPSTNNSLGKSSSWSQNGIIDLNLNNQKSDSMETITSSTLEEKVAKFIQNGELDAFEYESNDEDQGGDITMKYEDRIQSRASSDKEEIGGTAMAPNGTVVMPRVVAPQAVNRASQSHGAAEGEQLRSYDGEEDLSTKATKENQIELDHLRSMLHQKELELSCLREQIEKEKIALSALQTKSETEIRKAQKLISEKDVELDAAEENLSGLKEVNIQYSGEGEIVEVTGSFNGWHHQIKLDPQPSSAATDPIGSRKPRLWSTMLWLYPGTYEIKFIVDGQWRIDPQRESITRNGVCNNILRVDR